MSPVSSGWNGMYNGEKLPATDYWFTIEYLPQNSTDKQIFKAYFSLKR
jgi:gliding motility-associated-like protein